MSPLYLFITTSYILVVFAAISYLKKHGHPEWWTAVILAVYTLAVVAGIKYFT